MSDTTGAHNDNNDDGRDPRRKKIMFRCGHRGMKEMDLLLGGFANAEIDNLDEAELQELEHLLTAQDQDLYAWMTGRVPLPAEWDGPLYRRIIAYHEASGPAGFVR